MFDRYKLLLTYIYIQLLLSLLISKFNVTVPPCSFDFTMT